uniref:Uncharacterized protein n=1 Tax=Siphoviridae sp. ctf8W5 TaxID=2825595 RepID=A0A8S5Q6N0_9CAUD|nr:MAG TPA: hypothetical protein [Siphoviridae sp. ctf8W5]
MFRFARMTKIKKNEGRESAPFFNVVEIGGAPSWRSKRQPAGLEMRRGAAFLRKNLAIFTKRCILKKEKLYISPGVPRCPAPPVKKLYIYRK